MQAATTLKNLLMKHELDERYQEPKVKERIAGIYFPFILMVLSLSKSLEELITAYLFTDGGWSFTPARGG